MRLSSPFFLLSGLVELSAGGTLDFFVGFGIKAPPATPGRGGIHPRSGGSDRQSSPYSKQRPCHSDNETDCGYACAPIGSDCCGSVTNMWCNPGDLCVPGGCCPIAETCDDLLGPGECDFEKKFCGDNCIDESRHCCDEDTGESCFKSEVCRPDGGCTLPANGGNRGDVRDEDCLESQRRCGKHCIPKEATCCDDDVHWCFATQKCGANATCYGGELANGTAHGCGVDEKVCSISCIPSDTVCCEENDGYYCNEHEVCYAGGHCAHAPGFGPNDADDSSSGDDGDPTSSSGDGDEDVEDDPDSGVGSIGAPILLVCLLAVGSLAL